MSPRLRTTGSAYDRDFHLDLADVSARAASVIAPLLFNLVEPSSVIDVGCGAGAFLAAFGRSGVGHLVGIDGSLAPDGARRIPADHIEIRDLGRPLDLGRRFDLAICLEVAEHLPEARARSFVEDLAALAPVVAFSAAIPLQGGTRHVNERWQSWWAAEFRRLGYQPSLVARAALWDAPDLAAYYAQNLVIYASPDAVTRHRLHADETADTLVLDVVHPRLWERRARHPFLALAGQRLPSGTKNALTRRLRSRVRFLREL